MLVVPVRMVASYLVHHSYCATAEAFAKSTDQAVHEELASIKNRQSEWLPDHQRSAALTLTHHSSRTLTPPL